MSGHHNKGLLIQTVYSSWTPASGLLLDTQQPEGASRQQQVETEFALIDMERKMCLVFTTRPNMRPEDGGSEIATSVTL